MNQKHYTCLENMYLNAKVNAITFEGTNIKIEEEKAIIGLPVHPNYFHALEAVHGSVYFKLLDDACFFAVNSIVEDVFVLTTNFNINLIRPVNQGYIEAIGKVKFASKNTFLAEATLFNEEGKEIGFGTGTFRKSKVALNSDIGYKL